MAYDGELQNDPFCMHLRINVETPAAAHIGGSRADAGGRGP